MDEKQSHIDRKGNSDWWNRDFSSTWVTAAVVAVLIIGIGMITFSYTQSNTPNAYAPIRDITRDVTTGRGTTTTTGQGGVQFDNNPPLPPVRPLDLQP